MTPWTEAASQEWHIVAINNTNNYEILNEVVTDNALSVSKSETINEKEFNTRQWKILLLDNKNWQIKSFENSKCLSR